MNSRCRRLRIRSTQHYVVFRLEDEMTIADLRAAGAARQPVEPKPQLLALAMRSQQRAAATAQKVA